MIVFGDEPVAHQAAELKVQSGMRPSWTGVLTGWQGSEIGQ
ncbi:hypothetical protein RISK_002196 [Rhodopirellula islandica]|uniref:Uncharacterized protein n=1 Tax=Rhodopirellula islandica TaxID=595434 RepID=A0A0J1EJ51_RHOIS|nr:hypothetical protein RISK_002196 [Rhodopirellula islandica]